MDLPTDGRSLQRFLFLPENVWKWRSILLSLYLITKSISLSVAKESEKGKKSEEREGSIGLRQGLKLCAGPASYRALLLALEVTSSRWMEFQINWGAVSPWEQHGGNKMGNKVNIYTPGLLILSASLNRCLRVPWVEEGKAHRCLHSQIYSFPSLFQPIPKMSSPNSEH